MKIAGVAAVVTGGASGLGAAAARALAARGARVAVLDIDAAASGELARAIGGISVIADVTSEESAIAALAEAGVKHGPARVLVNCAGIGGARRIVGRDGPMPLADFERVVRVNLIGSFNMMRLAAAQMTTLPPLDGGERGIILSTASVAAFDGQIGQAAYAASKGGIVSLTLPAAREFAQFGVRVMALAPGIFDTPLLSELSAEARQGLTAAIPFPHRLGAPEEYAGLVLACIENAYLNGEVIRIDGALRMAPR